MGEFVRAVGDWLWGPPLLISFLGTGIYITVKLRAVQVTQFVSAMRSISAHDPDAEGDITPFASLMTAVGGIVGNGNIAGVATAITAGGPGALLWMWVSGIVGMGTMFAESVLGVRYRKKGKDGLFVGGPMYYLRDRLGWPRVATFFALGLAAKTLFATSTVQANSIASVVESEVGLAPWLTCLLVALVTAAAVVVGVRSIARVSEVLAPVMGVLYLGGAAIVIVNSWQAFPAAVALVFEHAFTPAAATGGFLGAGVREAFRFGVARGVYSNEAGTGSVPIAHASAKTSDPVRQGKLAMLGVFLDTMVVSSATGLVLLSSGLWTSGLDSTALMAQAFSQSLGQVGAVIVLIAAVLFGISTLITWAFYLEQCATYLWGPESRRLCRILYCVAILGGALGEAQVIWAWGDVFNGVVALPNLVAVIVLGGELASMLKVRRQSSVRPD